LIKAVGTRFKQNVNQLEVIEELIQELEVEEKLNINYKDPMDNNRTCLIKAAINGDLPLVNLLLRYGADVEAQDRSQITALIWAACEGEFEVVELLIQHKADLNAQDNSGLTALMMASMKDVEARQHYECVKILVNSGADPNLKSKDGKTALEYAEGEALGGLLGVGPSRSTALLLQVSPAC